MSLGAAELEAGAEPLGRARRPGGGRKPLPETDPGLVPALLALVEPEERGDPMSPLRWTTKSVRTLAAELTRQGHQVSADTVHQLLRAQGFSMQANAKTIEGKQHPDRDAQFRYISEQARAHQASRGPGDQRGHQEEGAGRPVRQRRPRVAARGRPGAGPRPRLPRPGAAARRSRTGFTTWPPTPGWVSVGTDHDTAAFAVESIRRWWHAPRPGAYPGARRLLITADAGGSNGYRTRAWKTELAALARETGLEITVLPLPARHRAPPSGTSVHGLAATPER